MGTNIRRLGADEARIIADALYAMAQADGVVDAREVEVLERFLRDCTSERPAATRSGPPDPAALARATEGLRDAFLFACAQLAFADGDFTAEEAVLLRRYAADLEVAPEHLEELVGLVEREQAVLPGPEPMRTLLEVLGGWSRTQLPGLREKVKRLFFEGHAPA
jgi:DnaJ-domain-containing protein 1